MQRAGTYPYLPFDSDRQLLVQPYGHGGSLLQQFENEVDGWEQDFLPTTPSAATVTIHECVKERIGDIGSGEDNGPE